MRRAFVVDRKKGTLAWLAAYIFCLVYAPPVFPNINFLWVQSVCTALLLVLRHGGAMSRMLSRRNARGFYVLFICAASYVLVTVLAGVMAAPVNLKNHVISLYRLGLVLVPVTICVSYVLALVEENGIAAEELMAACVLAGMIQAGITIITILSPEAKYGVASVVLRNTAGKTVVDIPAWEYSRRYFAFSDCMVDMIGIGSGILTALSFYLGCTKSSRYFLLTPILFLVPLFNAVTGVVVTGILIACQLPIFFKRRATRGKVWTVLFLLAAMSVAAMALLKRDMFAMQWVAREMAALFRMGKGDGTAVTSIGKVMDKSKWQIPDDWRQIVFGSGHTIYEAEGFQHSDIGYINMIWLCGLFGCALLYGSFAYLFFSAARACGDGRYRLLVLGMAISFFAFECKGIGVTYQPGMPLILIFTMLPFQRGGRAVSGGGRSPGRGVGIQSGG